MPSMLHPPGADPVVRALLRECKMDAGSREALRGGVQACLEGMFGPGVVWVFTHAHLNGTAVPRDVARVTVAETRLLGLPEGVERLGAGAYAAAVNGVRVVVSVRPAIPDLPQMRMSCKTRAAVCCAKHLLYETAGDPEALSAMWRMLELLGQSYFYSSVSRALTDSEMLGFLDFLRSLDFAGRCYTGFSAHSRDPALCIGQPQMSASDVLCRIINEGAARGVVLDDFDGLKNVFPPGTEPAAVLAAFARIHTRFSQLVLDSGLAEGRDGPGGDAPGAAAGAGGDGGVAGGLNDAGGTPGGLDTAGRGGGRAVTAEVFARVPGAARRLPQSLFDPGNHSGERPGGYGADLRGDAAPLRAS